MPERPWTSEMNADLREHLGSGLGYAEATSRLNGKHGTKRKVSAVRKQASKLGLGQQKKNHWTTEMVEALIEKKRGSKTHEAIANEINADHGSSLDKDAVDSKTRELELETENRSELDLRALGIMVEKKDVFTRVAMARHLSRTSEKHISVHIVNKAYTLLKELGHLVSDGGEPFWREMKGFLLKHGTVRSRALRRYGRNDLAKLKKYAGSHEEVLETLGNGLARHEKRQILLNALTHACRMKKMPRAYAELAKRTFGFGTTVEGAGDAFAEIKEDYGPVRDRVLPKRRAGNETNGKILLAKITGAIRQTPHMQDLKIVLRRNGRQNAPEPEEESHEGEEDGQNEAPAQALAEKGKGLDWLSADDRFVAELRARVRNLGQKKLTLSPESHTKPERWK